jgi:DinB superfamily
MPPTEIDLRDIVTAAAGELEAVTETAAAKQPGPGKWSAKEIVGHLIDSAANNHQRFVRARFQEDLVFAGYEQDEWVRAQRYQDEAWPTLLTLWRTYNLHLANVIAATPQDVRMRERPRHNLHEIAFRTVSVEQPATLEYFMRDYVDHLVHHLRQIAALVGAPRSVAGTTR